MMRVAAIVALCSQAVLGARYKRSVSSCGDLSGIELNGKNFGDVAKLLCQHWPKGDFPVDNAKKMTDLINTGMKKGGVWELLDKAKAANEGNFCWRQVEMKKSKSDACHMGYKPTPLSGVFKNVCTSACTESDYPVGCVLGCAKSKISCGLTIIDQITTVADILSNLKNITQDGVEGLATTLLDQVRAISDFALDTLKRIKATGDKIYASQGKNGTIAVLMTIVYTYTAERDGTIKDIKQLETMVKQVTDMVYNLLDGDFTVHGVATAVGKYGKSVLDQAISLAAPFTSNHCSPVDKKVAFTIEEAGDDEVIGAYIPNGKRDGRPKYVMKGNPRVGVEYSGRQNKWRFYKGSLTGIFSDNLYLADVSAEDYPTMGWVAQDAPDPAPEVITVQKP